MRVKKMRVASDEAEGQRAREGQYRHRTREGATPPKSGQPCLELRQRHVGAATHDPQLVHVLLLTKEVAERIRDLGRWPDVKPRSRPQAEHEQGERDAVDAPRIHEGRALSHLG